MGSQMTTTEGGYHLVSVAAMPGNPFMAVRKEASGENLIFGFAGPLKTKHVRTKFSETKWENSLPVENAADLPAGSEAAKQLLDDSTNAAPQRFLYGTSIEAFIRNRVSKLWLLNYSHPDMTMGTTHGESSWRNRTVVSNRFTFTNRHLPNSSTSLISLRLWISMEMGTTNL